MKSTYSKEYLSKFLEDNKESYFLPGKEKAKRIINTIIPKEKKVLIYGAGRIGKDILTILQAEEYKFIAFLDRDADNICKKNMPVFSPNAGAKIDDLENITVLISVFLSRKMGERLIVDLKQMGYRNVIFNENLISCFCSSGIRQSYLESLFKSKDEILEAFSLLQDNISREVFFKNLEAFSKWEFSQVIQQTDMVQYFDVQVPFKKGYSCFVDCGAYIGDSFIELLKRHKCDSYIAFEPDLENFEKLEKNVDKFATGVSDVVLYPCAVAEKNGYLFFHRDGATGGSLSTDAEECDIISVVSLDSVLKKKKVSMIKMDVEGAEIDALNGAKRIIKEQSPDLAICVYHKISDLWEIPLLINQINSDYVFYLRCHDSWGVETVLYATTKE